VSLGRRGGNTSRSDELRNSNREFRQKRKASLRLAFWHKASVLTDLEVKHIHDEQRFAIEQDNVAADHDVLAIRWRRRKTPLQIFGTTDDSLLQSRRERATHDQLALKTRRQPIAFRQTRRQMFIVLAIPAAHLIAVMIGIGAAVVVAIFIFIVVFIVASAMIPFVIAAVIVVIVAILFIVAVTVFLGNRQRSGERQKQHCAHSDSQPVLK
jgi:hypothetical protein